MKKHAQKTKAGLRGGIQALKRRAPTAHTALEHERLLHELQGRQVELETQSCELREAQLLLEGSRDRYADLYDFAPVGYVTFNDKGIIHEINLTAAGMLGVERARMVGLPFQPYVARADLARFREHLGQLENPQERVTTELRLTRKNGPSLPVVMQSVLVYDEESKRHLCRAALLDITARKEAAAATDLNQGILGALTAHIAVIDQEGRVFAVNDAWKRFALENSATTFFHTGVGLNYLSVCRKAADDPVAKMAAAGIENVLAGKQAAFQMEYPCHSPRERRWFFMSVAPLTSVPGGAVISHVNITGRKQTEEALRESGMALMEAQRVARIGSWSWNAATDAITWSEELSRIYGLVRDTAPPKYEEHLKLYTPESALRLNAAVAKALQSGEPYELDLERSRTGGARQWVAARGEAIREATGQIVGLRGTAQDITGRKQAEEEIGRLNESLEQRVQERTWELEMANESLRSSEARFRAIFEQAAVGVGLIETATGRFIRVNQRYCAILGMTPEQMLATTFMAITHRDDLAPDLEQMERMKQGLIPSFSMEKRLLRRDGSAVWVNLSVSGLWSSGEAPHYHMAVVEDITGRKRAEEEVRQLNQTLEQRVQERTAQLEAINAALQKSEARLAEAQTIAGVGSYELNVRTGEIFWSDETYRLWARDPRLGPVGLEEVFTVIHEDDRARVRAALDQSIATGVPLDEPLRIIWPDGTVRHLHAKARAERDLKRRSLRLVGTIQDITKRKRAEEALQASEERLRLVLEASELGMFEINLVTNEGHWNNVEFELLGLKPGDAPPNPDTFLRFVHPDDLDRVRAQWEEATRTGELDAEFRIVRADGRERWLAGKGRFASGGETGGEVAETGRPATRFLGVNFDITARKQAEEALRASEERFRQVTETIDQVFWMTTVDKKEMLYISPAYERIWGRSCQSLYDAPRTWLDAIHPTDRPSLAQAVTTKQATGEYNVEYRILRPDGSERWIHDRGFPIPDASGKVRRIAGVAADITDAKRGELRRRLQYETARLLSASASLSEVIPKLLQTVTETFQWDVGEFWEIEGETGRLHLAQSWQAPGKKFAAFVKHSLKLSFSISEGLPGRVFSTRQPNWIPDIAQSPHFARKDLAEKAGLRSAVAFPITLHHDTLGVMAFMAHRVTEPDADLLEVFTSVGSQIGQFMERKKAEAALHEAHEFGKQVIGGAQTGIIVYDQEGRIVVWNPFMEQMTGNRSEEVLGAPGLQSFPFLHESHFGKMFARALAGEVFEAPDILFNLPENGKRGWTLARFAPWRDARQEIVGVIVAVRDITERKRLENEILAISDREQRKFGYDLHDGLGQRLTALEMLSHSLAEDLQGHPPALARQAIRLNHELRETVTQARLISHSLAPVPLEGDGLMRGLAELAASTSQLPRVVCRFHCDPPVLIHDVTTATHLYRIAQEAVNNALKHGQARKIDLSLREHADGVVLSVENNGRAIPLTNDTHHGLGLNVMRYRAEMIGASLSIESGPRQGARIACTLRKKI